MSRGKKILLALLVLLAAGGGAVGFRAWQNHQRLAALVGVIPPKPDLAGQPAALVTRVTLADTRLRRGDEILTRATELASLYHANGFLPEAAACYQALATAAPTEPRWPHRLASIYAGFGQLEVAVPLWQRAVALQPDFAPARIRLGDALLKLNRDREATEAYDALIARDADNPYALLGLARLDLRRNAPGQARTRLERALAVSRGAIGYDLLATACEQLGDHARAAELRGTAKSSGAYYDPPDAWLDDIYFDCYDALRVCLAAGVAEHSGDTATARRLFEHAVAFAPREAQVFLNYGLFAMQRQELPLARQQFEQALALDPRLPDAWAQLVVIHQKKGDTAAAERALAQGLAQCPQSPGLHLEHARRLAARGQVDAAIAAFRTSARLRPEEAGALFELANLLLQLDRTDEAIREIRRALEIEPDHPTGLVTLALHGIATGDQNAARHWLGRARAQVRVPRDQLANLAAQFQEQFGRSPW